MATKGSAPAVTKAGVSDFLARERDTPPSTPTSTTSSDPAPKEPTPAPDTGASTPSTTTPAQSTAASSTDGKTAEQAKGSGDPAVPSQSAPGGDKPAPAEPAPTTPGAADQQQPPRRRRCAFSFMRRVCALPAVQGAILMTSTAYEKVKHSTRVTEVAFSAAETGAQLVAGPCALAAVPICLVMAVPICVADFGLNRTLDLVEYFAPCIKYDSEEAKKAAARVGVRIVTLPESAVAATVALLNTCPGRAVVKVAQTSTSCAGKTVDLLLYFPKSGENAVADTVFRYVRLPCSVAQRIVEAAEHSREALRDRLIEMS